MIARKLLPLFAVFLCVSLIYWRSVFRCTFARRAVIITGGSRGLGLALASQLAREKADLALVARDREELERAKAALSEYGSTVTIWPCDVRDEAQLRQTIQEIGERFGRIDVLINNAGEIVVGPFESMNREDFERAMQIHFWAPLIGVFAALPFLRERSSAWIINIASFGGRVAVPHLGPYCVSKFALAGLSDSLRAELIREHISVTTVTPGLMRTGSHKNALFKGAHRKEFAWFSLGAANPLISMGADRAAKQIVNAARKRRASLTITLPAGAVVVAQALFPNLVARVLGIVAKLLPGMPARGGTEIHSGWESQSKLSPSILTVLADRATDQFNGKR
ncbi:MAG: SDR family oxidoreductase [Verrucomicrobia bacterium]|nr:SDR family oxidoreductase [Verrucomicrobiota bacterium]